ncbi:hypothetical protein Hanom_Chr14g01262151 [Helianthus anomalus]
MTVQDKNTTGLLMVPMMKSKEAVVAQCLMFCPFFVSEVEALVEGAEKNGT